jgi:hypothetical protein
MIKESCSFQCVNDSKATIAWSVSAVGAVAIAVSFVALTYFQLLPEYGYYIAGGGFVGALAIGALIATLRRNNEFEHFDYVPSFERDDLIPTQLQQEEVGLPFEEIYKERYEVKVNVSPIEILPPDKTCAFVTATFTFTLQGKEYVLRVAQFYEGAKTLLARAVINQSIMTFHVNDGTEWPRDDMSIEEKSSFLNQSLK